MKSSDFYKNDRFMDYLFKTEVYKEAYKSKEGIVSIILAFICLMLILISVNFSAFSVVQNALFVLLGIILGGAFGLLGFLVGGLGILIGSISDEMISIIDKNNSFESLLAIVFRFYYDGAILAILILFCIFDYLILMLPFDVNFIFFQ